MDYKINHSHCSYIVSTGISDGQEENGRQILVSMMNDVGMPDFLYMGDSVEDAVGVIEEDIGTLEGLRAHISEYWDKAGLVCWSSETLLLDEALVYIVEFKPVMDAETDTREMLTDDIEEALRVAQNANFVLGGSVVLKTLSQVVLYDRTMGEDGQEFRHDKLDELRHLEAERRSCQISAEENDPGFAPGIQP